MIDCPQRDLPTQIMDRFALNGTSGPVADIRGNPYEFITERAHNASADYVVKSASLLMRKER